MGTEDSVLRRQIFVLQKEVQVNYPSHVGQQPSPLISSHMDRPSCHSRILNDLPYFDHTTSMIRPLSAEFRISRNYLRANPDEVFSSPNSIEVSSSNYRTNYACSL